MFQVEIGSKLSQEAYEGLRALLIGSAIIFTKAHHADRLKLIGKVWSKGHYTEGAELFDSVFDVVRKNLRDATGC